MKATPEEKFRTSEWLKLHVLLISMSEKLLRVVSTFDFVLKRNFLEHEPQAADVRIVTVSEYETWREEDNVYEDHE